MFVLSPDYLKSFYTQPEWAAAFFRDPTGEHGTVLPVRVQPCNPSGLLSSIVYINLVDRSEEQARTDLLNGIQQGRITPTQPPIYPG